MNKNYVREDDPTPGQRPWIVRWFWLLYLGGLALMGIVGLLSMSIGEAA